MCGRYGFSVKDAGAVYGRFNIEQVHYELKSRYNVAPGEVNPIIISHSPNELIGMFWGLIPFWARDDKFKFNTINAKSEDADIKPAFRKPFRTQRCLVPATGFYEWMDRGKKEKKQPYYFTLEDKSMFAFAGLYDIWKNPKDGKQIMSYTILTCQPNEIVAKIHNRMPVILDKKDEADWVNPDIVEVEHIRKMIAPFPGENMDAYPVSTMVNNARYDEEDLIKPLKQ